MRERNGKAMDIIFNNSLGQITVDPKIVAEVAGAVACKCYGVAGMASKNTKDGIVSLLRPDSAGRGVNVTVGENGVLVELHIVIQFGLNINSTCESIVHRVRYTLEGKMGLPVKCINIKVDGVRVSE